MSPVEVVVRPDGAAEITLTRERALNALSPDLLAGLRAAIDEVSAAGAPAAVVRGRGPALSAGADLPHLLGLLDDPADVRAYIASIGAALDALEAAPFVSLCVVDGYGLAGGCELMLACDLAVVSSSARLGDRHMEYGLLPGAGGSVRLPRALPAALARRLLYTGEIIDGDTAAAWGLVGWSVPPAELDATVEGIVARLVRHSPTALRTMKELEAAGRERTHRAALDHELDVAVQYIAGHADVREGLAAFREKREPRFGTTKEESR
ncbi:enoyl-CoA hydratase/isomerase family protein [Pseudonocardia sp. WMMC193]|uniref:enoyl-CoA hydratase/isomerase family protein n=1 Tax=Pseudonocardia sp. WMMC193 TaxID=2911965 RepID=UPI001F3AE478|nr:enoyl-CoA hydratase/isomerase family protein [Pseudonocardia sp. WMMC193]MCF7551358.1 enoyl-CoA hydratase/isomerase family protein [Pseudonocardia sp. WMMC193]